MMPPQSASVDVSSQLDALSVFPAEESAPTQGRVLTESRPAPSRHIPAADVRATRVEPQRETKYFQASLGQTQVVLQRLQGDARALRTDLSELRSVGAHLSQGYTRLGDVCRSTEKRSEALADVLNTIEQRIEPLEVVRDLSATANDKLASLNRLVEEVMECRARFEAQKGAIDQGREEAARAVQVMEELHARVTTLTATSNWLRQAEETVGRLEHRAIETTARLERRLNDIDARKRALERTVGEVMHVAGILDALESRVGALTGSHHALGQAERAVDQLERRTSEAQVRLEQVKRGSAAASRFHGWKVAQPLLRSTTIGAAVVASLLAGMVLRTRDQSSLVAGTASAAHQGSLAAPSISLPPASSHVAPFDVSGVRGTGTTGTITDHRMASADRPGPAPATRTASTAGASRLAGAEKETGRYVGILSVASEPPGSVAFVDGQQVGRTPLQLRRLRAGSHVVRIDRDGYDRWTTAVLVPADKQTRVSAKLQATRVR